MKWHTLYKQHTCSSLCCVADSLGTGWTREPATSLVPRHTESLGARLASDMLTMAGVEGRREKKKKRGKGKIQERREVEERRLDP